MKKHLVAALILALAPFAASARDSLGSYTYIEAGFNRLSVDSNTANTVDFDGAYLRSSIELSDNLYFHGGLAFSRNSDLPTTVNAREIQLGLGYKYNVADNVDLIAEAAFQRQEFKAGSLTDVANNTRLGVGVRGAVSNSIEGWVKANYVDGGRYQGTFVGTLGAQFVFSEKWGIVGEVDAGGDESRFMLGVRASF